MLIVVKLAVSRLTGVAENEISFAPVLEIPAALKLVVWLPVSVLPSKPLTKFEKPVKVIPAGNAVVAVVDPDSVKSKPSSAGVVEAPATSILRLKLVPGVMTTVEVPVSELSSSNVVVGT